MNILGNIENAADETRVLTTPRKLNPDVERYADWIDTRIDVNWLPINNDSHPSNVKPEGLKPQASENGILLYGMKEVIETFQSVIKDFHDSRVNSDYSDTIYYNDVSKYKGGVTNAHASHQLGTDVD
jgi:hypothetical protein